MDPVEALDCELDHGARNSMMPDRAIERRVTLRQTIGLRRHRSKPLHIGLQSAERNDAAPRLYVRETTSWFNVRPDLKMAGSVSDKLRADSGSRAVAAAGAI